ncbi:MAG: hypothetical protein V7K67_20880 [Nostoc sp.]|uniref:hypothetical protein n=1 Tax=Nostoc sp. TaxID=1180 RepID=UPI002FFC87B3
MGIGYGVEGRKVRRSLLVWRRSHRDYSEVYTILSTALHKFVTFLNAEEHRGKRIGATLGDATRSKIPVGVRLPAG